MLTPVRRLFARVHAFLRPGLAERELAREIDAHLALIEEEGRRRGLSAEEARLAARRAFGGIDLAKERQRDARSFLWLEQLRQDVRYAARRLARTPGFTGVVVLTLALGIGANTAIFSVIHAVLLKPLPYLHADRLVRLVEHVPAGETRNGKAVTRTYFTAADFDVLARHAGSLSGVAAYDGAVLTMVGPHGATRLMGAEATPSLFRVLEAQPILGRLFTRQDARAGQGHLVVLSYQLWKTVFDGDPHVVGRSVTVQSLLGRARPPESYTVIGVMPPGFHLLDPVRQSRLWIPFPAKRPRLIGFIVGRFAPAVTLAAAQAEVGTILHGERDTASQPGAFGSRRFQLIGARDELVRSIRPALLVLALAAVFVLLIACVNVANLFLARTMTRRQEMAVRMALGGGRSCLVRHVLTEMLLLAGLGALGGIGLAFGGVDLLRTLGTTLARIDVQAGLDIPRLRHLTVDAPGIIFAALLAVASGLASGLIAAWRVSAPEQASALHEGTSAQRSGLTGLRRFGGRGWLVAGETALAMMLLVTGGLLLRSFGKLATVDPGFDPDHTLTFQVALAGYSDARLEAFSEQLVARARRLPGVVDAAVSREVPMVNLEDHLRIGLTRPGRHNASPVPPDQQADIRLVSASYFGVLRMRMVAGQAWKREGGPGRPREVVINEALARRDFAGLSPLGRSIYIGSNSAPWTIVGVVGSTHEFALAAAPKAEAFVDTGWIDDFGFPPYPLGPYCVLRGSGNPVQLLGGLRTAARELDPEASLINVATMNQLLANSLTRHRLYAVWTGILALVGILLAAIGVYGVLAYAVEARTREIGIRRALGAQARDVLGLVLRQSMIVAGVGLAVGLAGAVALSGYLRGLLFGLTPLDPTTYWAAAILFVIVTAVAVMAPARRAAHVDPLVAIRSE